MFDLQDSRSKGRARRELGGRLRQVRLELYGEDGVPALARLLGVPDRTWSNYERGVTIPGELLLALLELCRVEPRWLFSGEGATFRETAGDGARQPTSGSAVRSGHSTNGAA